MATQDPTMDAPTQVSSASLEASEVAQRLGVDVAVGLSQAEARAGCRRTAPTV